MLSGFRGCFCLRRGILCHCNVVRGGLAREREAAEDVEVVWNGRSVDICFDNSDRLFRVILDAMNVRCVASSGQQTKRRRT
jgi:hypothetical protein